MDSGNVKKIDNKNNKFKLPHIGWNEINHFKNSKLFKDIKEKSHVYFVHSYKFIPDDKDVFQQQQIIHQEIVAQLKKKIYLEHNFIQKKVIKLV